MAKKGLGEWLRQRRKEELGLSLGQVQVRTQGAVESSYLSKIERGLVQPSANILIALAPVLKVDVQELYRLAGYLPEGATAIVAATTPDDDPLDVVDRLLKKSGVTPEKRRAVRSVLKSVLADVDR